MIAGGLVFLTVLADRVFGFTVTRREWVGVGARRRRARLPRGDDRGLRPTAPTPSYEPLTIAIYIAVLSTAGLACWRPSPAGAPHAGVIFGASAGLIWAASDVAIKGSSGSLADHGLAVLVEPLAAVVVIASLIGLLISAKSLQIGEAVPVIAVTSVAANAATIASGPIVFGDPLPSTAIGGRLESSRLCPGDRRRGAHPGPDPGRRDRGGAGGRGAAASPPPSPRAESQSCSRPTACGSASRIPSPASAIAFGLPGKLTISVVPRTPQTPRETIHSEV